MEKNISPVIINRTNSFMEIILNNPSKLNCLTHDMFTLLNKETLKLRSCEDVKVVLLKGSGPTAFCSGGDVAAICKVYKSKGKQAAREFGNNFLA